MAPARFWSMAAPITGVHTTLALAVVGKEITTCESLLDDEIPKAFVKHDAQQCGFLHTRIRRCRAGFSKQASRRHRGNRSLQG